MKRTDKEIIDAMEFIKEQHNGELPYKFGTFECAKMMAKYLSKAFNISGVGSSYHLNEKELSKFKELDSNELRMYNGNGIGVKTMCMVNGELIDITDYGSW